MKSSKWFVALTLALFSAGVSAQGAAGAAGTSDDARRGSILLEQGGQQGAGAAAGSEAPAGAAAEGMGVGSVGVPTSVIVGGVLAVGAIAAIAAGGGGGSGGGGSGSSTTNH